MKKYKQIVREIILLDNIRSLLQWDQETYMPVQASAQRGQQVAMISGMVHQQFTSSDYAQLLEKLYSGREQLSANDQRFIAIKKRTYDLASKLPQNFVLEMAEVTSLAQQAWVEAKTTNRFEIFEPYLTNIIALNRKKAAILNPESSPYEVLLDTFENGLTIKRMDEIFTSLTPVIREILVKRVGYSRLNLSQNRFSVSKQKDFSAYLLKAIGYDFNQGSLDEVMHPFMTRLGQKDTRVTNNYDETNLTCLFSALHEGGHALFEQGFSDDYSDLLTDDERSLGIHESQSRFWENMIGRSHEFWTCHYSELQTTFGLTDSLQTFLQHINYVQPSFIRTESDEVTYNLHVQIRYELEKQLVSGSLAAGDVPEAWNDMYEKYLGIRPTTDAEGCLQDVHWSHGTIGYFPTYTLGNVISGQFWNTYKKFDPEYKQTVISGDYSKILNWFRVNVHNYGPLVPTDELVRQVTGEEISSKYLAEYLQNKYL